MKQLSILLFAALLGAEEPAKLDCEKHPEQCASNAAPKPTIPAAHSAEFWAAAARLQASQAQAVKDKEAFDAAQAVLAKDCGPDHNWNVNVASKPVCEPKPVPKQ